MIKVLYVNEHIELNQNGGDMVQMINTKRYIEKKYDNIEITLCKSISKENFADYDLIHIFNLQTADYTFKAVEKAKRHNKKVILSTIYWDLHDASIINTFYKVFGILPNIHIKKFYKIGDVFNRLLYRVFKNKTSIMYNKKKIALKILRSADFILPNSDEEFHKIIDFYGLSYEDFNDKTVIVPNAVNLDYMKENIENEVNNNNDKSYVLQVGAINVVKNQYNLIKALYDIPEISIVIIGRHSDNKYYNKVKSLADKRGNVKFIEEVTNKEIYSFYKNALCHVLPSYRESPGLVSLEALAMGCPIVVSSETFCPINYYQFNKYATICDPYSCDSIKEAILENINCPKNSKLDVFEYLSNFSYEKAADLTFYSYRKLLFGEEI